ncbi:hypothetical protein N7452_005775 [Penicillium brevicompactum]|uniref:Uncharacterized protein n=1 Tax=Penicillium brevicompactum TaxID=5074 RepID=A0A9W9QJ95_PENBR|nr:hypothetical protein N7452_005775 [Penicillium brevicompactum]
MSTDRRRRRASFSEHISRVFKSDKRASHGEFVPPLPFLSREAAQQAEESNAARVLDDETPSSVSYSPMHSRLPSTGTPGSSLSVPPGEDETPTQTTHSLAKEVGIGKSPALEKPNKKEKRVTRRLEAERRELEKRLLALEDAQSKVDLGVHDRTSRRLTKKQPVSNSSRSSSANSERPKSSGGLSAIFRRSRRSSASSDLENQYAEFSRLQTDTKPPSLPLTLPERFGTAITRELQSKHGTALNLSTANKTVRPTTSRLLHATPKSDDLRENWKMAEAWKAQHGTERSWSLSKKLKDGRSAVGNARNGEALTKPVPDELDRDLFAAALKHDRKSLPTVDHSLDRVNRNDRTMRASSMPASQSLAQTFPPCPAKIAIPPEIAAPESPDTPSSVARIYTPLQLAQSNSTGSLARRNRVDPYPRTYKSSPLALNPADTNDSSPKDSMIPTPLSLHDSNQPPPQPSPLPGQSQSDDEKKSRIPVPSSNTPPQTASRFKEDFNEPSQPDPPRLPAKSERRSLDSWRVPTTSSDTLRDIPHSPFQVGVRSPFHTGNTSPGAKSHRTSRDMSDSHRVSQRSPQRASRSSHDQPRGPGIFRPGHSRTSSHNSDYEGHSNYDTADEDAPESPDFSREPMTLEPKPEKTSKPSKPSPTLKPAPILQPTPVLQPPPVHRATLITKPTLPIKPLTSPTHIPKPAEQSPKTEPPTNQPMQPDLPEPRGPMSLLKRRSQRSKPRQLAKIFVICCRCKYWHDLPSEVYARLAYPERTDEPKLNGRKKNDRKPASRISLQSAVPAAHAVQGMDLRPAPLLPRKVSCCWCGHNMSRSCCEGWTAIVEMRERHH